MKLRLRAPAKLNLTLEILGRRSDGFHEIRSVMQAISIYDTLVAEPAPTITVDAPVQAGPADENLVLRAATRLRESAGQVEGARIRLEKRIPVGAGLGGGSTDAAATLRLLVRLWRAPAPAFDLKALAAELGSDVPFFLRSGAALAAGRGEQIQALPSLREGFFVVVAPRWQEPRKTQRVYAMVTTDDFSSGQVSSAVASTLSRDGNLPSVGVTNALERAAGQIFPALQAFRSALETLSGERFCLSGAGPAVFHFSLDRSAASRLARQAARLGEPVYLARPLAALPRIGLLKN